MYSSGLPKTAASEAHSRTYLCDVCCERRFAVYGAPAQRKRLIFNQIEWNMVQKLFWCSTVCGSEDYWVVAPSVGLAIAFFAQESGFDLDEVRAEEVLTVPDQDRPLLDPVVAGPSDLPKIPSAKILARWNIFFNDIFHVFYYRGRIFRPQALVRDYMRSRIRERVRGRQRFSKSL